MRRLFALFAMTLIATVVFSNPSAAQDANYLSPGMQYDNMWQAGASMILTQSMQNLRMQQVTLRLSGGRSTGSGSSQTKPAEPQPTQAEPSQTATRSQLGDYSATDFAPVRQGSVVEQFANLSSNSKDRAKLEQFAEMVFNLVEDSSEFRRNNLSYAVGLSLAAAIGIERGRPLNDAESIDLLNAVHAMLTETEATQKPAQEITSTYDTCILFAGMMVTLDADPQSRSVARKMADSTLKAFGYK